MTTIVDSKGRITIPVELRRSLGIEIGEELEFIIVNDKLIIQRKLSVNEFHLITKKLSGKYARQITDPIDMEKLI